MNFLSLFSWGSPLLYGDLDLTTSGAVPEHFGATVGRPFDARFDAAAHSPFTVEGTQRFDIDGTSEITMDSFNRVTELVWRPAPREIVSEVLVDYFVRHCREELGDAEHTLEGGVETWRWSADGIEREVRASYGADGALDLLYTERQAPVAAMLGTEAGAIIELTH